MIILAIGTLIIKENLIKNNKNYKGELATNKQQQNLSIFVLPAIPIITIISPENITYSTNTILLNYSIKNTLNSIWYNLNNEINITIDSPLQFTTIEGSHTLYLYANNSYGTATKNISFFVNLTAESTTTPEEGNKGGGGGSGGGGAASEGKKENITCEKSFVCNPWSICINNLQYRNCTDMNYCEEPNIKIENKTCATEEKPSETEIPKKSSWILFIILLIILLIILILTILIKRKKGKKYFKKKLRQINALREPSFG
jgi:hypothetical protein